MKYVAAGRGLFSVFHHTLHVRVCVRGCVRMHVFVWSVHVCDLGTLRMCEHDLPFTVCVCVYVCV